MVPKAQKKGVTFASKDIHSNMEVKSKNIKKTVNKKVKKGILKNGLSKKNGFAVSEVTKGKGKKHHKKYDDIEDAAESVDSLDSGFVADNNSDTSLSSANWMKVESDYLGESRHVSDILDWHPDILSGPKHGNDDGKVESLELKSSKKDAKKEKKAKDAANKDGADKKSREAKVEKEGKTKQKNQKDTEEVEDEEFGTVKEEITEENRDDAKEGKSGQERRWFEPELKAKKKICTKAKTVVELENLKEDYQEKLAVLKQKRKKGVLDYIEERQEKKLQKKITVIERRKEKMAKKKKSFRADLGQLEDMKKKAKEERKAELKARKAYYNIHGKLVYSKFDFSEHTPILQGVETKLRPEDLKVMLAKTLKEKEKRKDLEQKGAGDVAAKRMEEAAWSSAMQKAEGKKVRDDVDLLRKSIKLKEKRKKTSSKKWEHRKEMVQKRQEEKQARRKRNIKAQKEAAEDEDEDEDEDEEEEEEAAEDEDEEEEEAAEGEDEDEEEDEDEGEEEEEEAAEEEDEDDEEEEEEAVGEEGDEDEDEETDDDVTDDAEDEGDIQAEEDVLEWLIEQRHEDTIENINRQLLYTLIDTQDYLAVYFFNEENDECPKVLRVLEKIDDEAAEYGIQLVKMNDRLMAKKYGFRNPPGLVYFRKGKHIKYEGDLYDDEDVLDWLTAPENMELNDAIEKVNRKMFERIKQTTDYLAVFFYAEEGCKQCQKVLAELENIDDEADANGIDFVKIDDSQLAKEVGVFALPAIVFYRAGSEEPIIYAGGDMKNEENLLSWLLTEKDPTADFIEDMYGDALLRVIRDSDAIAVYFYNEDTNACSTCMKVLEELENIDDDTDRIGVKFVKTQDAKVAERYGVVSMPALLYFEHQIPTVYEGDLLAEEDVLQWLILQKTEDRIETINRNMLEVMLEDTQYLAVFFYKPNCRACDTVLAELENIDDECDVYGIHMVKIQDTQLAKRYGIKTLPALIYFRNGNPLIFDDDLVSVGTDVLEWLSDEETRKLDDDIEEVNANMLDFILATNPYVAVIFTDEDDCADCEQVLQELENIDDEVDMFGIDFVKINDPDAAQRFNILHTPALVYFRKKTPLVYDGDLLDEEKVFNWLTSQDVFEIKDEIEEVNRKMLEKLLDENDFVAVFFYEDNPKCEEVLTELEKIDDDTDDLDITFVKIRDTRYAKKYGIQKLPALVYFRRRFPSIYRGDLMVEDEVLEWLQKNRFKHPELNLFMYATGAITFAFIMYTFFLIFCFKTPHQKAA